MVGCIWNVGGKAIRHLHIKGMLREPHVVDDGWWRLVEAAGNIGWAGEEGTVNVGMNRGI